MHATFFMLGENHVDERPAEVQRIDAEGHELANHTWSHQILTDIAPEEARRAVPRPGRGPEDHRQEPRLMRPPQGRTDEEVSKISKELGLAQVLWSVTAKDYQTDDSALITKRVLEQTERDGIILLHDIYKGTVPAVPGIIKELKKRGYTVVTVSQLLSRRSRSRGWSTGPDGNLTPALTPISPSLCPKLNRQPTHRICRSRQVAHSSLITDRSRARGGASGPYGPCPRGSMPRHRPGRLWAAQSDAGQSWHLQTRNR